MGTDGNDTFTKTTRTGWGARLKNALAGFIIGPILIIGSIWALAWNEGRSAEARAALSKGEREVVAVSPESINKSLEGKLVYITGDAATNETLRDPMFGVEKNALWLQRDTDMYQWQEEKDSSSEKYMGGSETTTTTYRYSKIWSSSLIRSSSFEKPDGHANPNEFRVPANTFVAHDVKIGSFHLKDSIVRAVDGDEPVLVTENQKSPVFADARLYDGYFYIGADPAQPKVGDMRVRFRAVTPGTVSIVGAQVGESIGSYFTENRYEIALVRAGSHTAHDLFQSALTENSIITWIIRFVGFIFLYIGISAPLKILSVLGDVVPIIGDIIGFGLGLISLILALVVWAVTIAIAWFAYRPIAAIVLLTIVCGIAFLLYRRRCGKVMPLATSAAA